MKTRINTMRNQIKFFLLSIIIVTGIGSCSDWTDLESKYEPEKFDVGYSKDETYYENLRNFKSTMFDRKLSWAWFGGWTGEGAYLLNSLAGLPDSLDIISIWGGHDMSLTPERKKDLEYVQKVKGSKVLLCIICLDIGDGMTPKGLTTEERKAYWGWVDGDNESIYAAIRKYANAICDKVDEVGYDGFDLDWEPGYAHPFETNKELAPQDRYEVFMEALAERLGPKSGTGKLLCIDGEINAVPTRLVDSFDLFVTQAYVAKSFHALDIRDHFLSYLNKHSPEMDIAELCSKVVVTEKYEDGFFKTGGTTFTLPSGEVINSLKGMAMWNPTYKGIQYERSGGAGVFLVQYEYNVTATNGYTGFYPWIREAIQVMNPSNESN